MVGSISADWKAKQVVFMTKSMTPEFKAEVVATYPDLRSYSNEATPHNPADEGFVCPTEDVVISFPAPGEVRRWY